MNGVDAPWMRRSKDSIFHLCPIHEVGSGPGSMPRRPSGGRPSSIHRAGSDRMHGTGRCLVRPPSEPFRDFGGLRPEWCGSIADRTAMRRGPGWTSIDGNRDDAARIFGSASRVSRALAWNPAIDPQWTSVPFATAASGPRSVMPPDAASAPRTRTSLRTPAISRVPRSVATTTWRPTSASGV